VETKIPKEMEERFDLIDKRFDEVIERMDRIEKQQVEINRAKRWIWFAIIILLIPIVIGILNSTSVPVPPSH
jgi:hypothetical protein